ncbi:uncharacterized protein LOC131956084 [Physella acuta]|uniref:uncharacterized protein LOC131956084 n=1 Tax=Physella acuta TaxID=109671 RepID=UPI0027DB2E85|nr:uncharacterized protein LOC131956084 [Physella acuta]
MSLPEKCIGLRENVNKLEEVLCQKDETLSKLIQERNSLLKTVFPETTVTSSSASMLSHYRYILPLVKDIYLLELQLKECQKDYDESWLKLQAADLYGDLCFKDTTVLTKWHKELEELSCKEQMSFEPAAAIAQVTNVTYQTHMGNQTHLMESLGFTVLNNGVHVRLKIETHMQVDNMHVISPTQLSLCVECDTFINGLEEKVQLLYESDGHIHDIVKMITQYSDAEMAPYVIIIPLKKKKKTKITKETNDIKQQPCDKLKN